MNDACLGKRGSDNVELFSETCALRKLQQLRNPCITVYKINKVLLCSIGNYIQYLVIAYNGKEFEKKISCAYVCVCITLLYTRK